MSRVQPPGDPVPFLNPFGELKAAFGFGGHVVSAGLMKSSIVNGPFRKWLVNVVPVVASVHVAGSAARLTSFCIRHVYGWPASLTWVFFSAGAVVRPRTPSQPPYRLSKLWFSS